MQAAPRKNWGWVLAPGEGEQSGQGDEGPRQVTWLLLLGFTWGKEETVRGISV